jgi:hypothetical protein
LIRRPRGSGARALQPSMLSLPSPPTERQIGMNLSVGQSFFLTAATLGLGFCALVSILSLIKRTSGTIEYQDIMGVRFMLVHSFLVTFFSLYTVSFSFSSRFHSISIVSVPWALALLWLVVLEAVRWFQGRSDANKKPRHPWLFLFLYLLPQAAIGMWLLTSGRDSLAWYSGALIWPLIPVAIQFLTFVSREAKRTLPK